MAERLQLIAVLAAEQSVVALADDDRIARERNHLSRSRLRRKMNTKGYSSCRQMDMYRSDTAHVEDDDFVTSSQQTKFSYEVMPSFLHCVGSRIYVDRSLHILELSKLGRAGTRLWSFL